MVIKDIVNRDNVNLQNCDQEPIHIPGTIQPHGFLIAVDKNSGIIKFCSGNSDVYLNINHEKILDKHIKEIFTSDVVNTIENLFLQKDGKISVLKSFIEEKKIDFISHISGDYLIIEAEQQPYKATNNDLIDLSSEFVPMEETQSLKELCDLVAVTVKKVTGYDRVMVYRFDENYNGEVISESKNEELEGFLGLHYPHTDIPVQARQLYIKNQLRIIVDVNYTPVPIYTTNQVKNDGLDLSLSVLRSVSPIHIQYLNNMGVGATLNISLMLRGKLWGLIACHHYSPKYLTYDVRMSAKLLGHFITSQIDARNLNEEHEIRHKANNAVEHFRSKKIKFNRNSLQEIINDPQILSVCNADGAVLFIKNSIYKCGVTPSDKEIVTLAKTLKDKTNYKTESLDIPEISSVNFPGLNFYSLQKENGDCMMWFRRESIHDVNWAGDPNKSIEKDRNGLSPRKSFELYKETVKNKSKVWLDSELDASLNFVNILERHISSIVLAEEEEKQRLLANNLMQTNAELENINYISTHDLQEPLRKIQMTASVLLANTDQSMSTDSFEKIQKMSQFAGRMQFLIKEILKYTQLNYSVEAFEDVPLTNLLKNIKAELIENINEKNATLQIANLPVVHAVSFLIKQLFTNLINNSLKFSDPARNCVIEVSVGNEAEIKSIAGSIEINEYHIIKFKDNGVGFEKENNEKVFKIFTRLYNSEQIVGSGIGLAICRKIMQTHNGFIFAEGEINKGATFYILFPKKQTY